MAHSAISVTTRLVLISLRALFKSKRDCTSRLFVVALGLKCEWSKVISTKGLSDKAHFWMEFEKEVKL